MKELQRQANSNIVIAFVGNKIDLVQDDAPVSEEDEEDDEEDDATATGADDDADTSMRRTKKSTAASKRQVSTEEAQAYATEAGLLFAETSAKTGEGVVEIFTEIGEYRQRILLRLMILT